MYKMQPSNASSLFYPLVKIFVKMVFIGPSLGGYRALEFVGELENERGGAGRGRSVGVEAGSGPRYGTARVGPSTDGSAG
ncbi:hypothetical protein V1477_004447 [Vespula maculifrons]|uniref:Uncharacterized protein n=1 Tax=Vespula maculifrons TaxID=7453 RepID=A0ABD2CRM7_VESMC